MINNLSSWRSVTLAALLSFSLAPESALAGAKEGEKVFEDNKCIACHTLNGKSGKLAKKGGPLDGVGKKRDAAWLKKYMTDPTSALPNAQMEKADLSPADLDAVVAYLASLK